MEPFKEVLRRQVPSELGKPISMKVYDIKQPKDCGNPWNGAYSKHGFWYKFYEGNSSDFEKVRRKCNCILSRLIFLLHITWFL
ncbi:unnamed protein product [Toxocara canis]|uniref:Uncharacterized protein n=1 Tax=Toxocara canis TaxID=6265 RepID=A0A3P7GW88_TOXCA|nr:unnamed protein product [Toxocara canis]